jgi:hypothetical protein
MARLKNLRKCDRAIEDVLESEDEEFCPPRKQITDQSDEGFFFLDEELNDDSESEFEDGEVEEDDLTELRTEAELFRFNSILAEAQAVAIQAEKEAVQSKPKRKRHYTGNSARTIRHYALKCRQLEANEQSLINSWFSKEEKIDPPILHLKEIVDEEAEQSEDELEEPEIEECVNRVFADSDSIATQVCNGLKKRKKDQLNLQLLKACPKGRAESSNPSANELSDQEARENVAELLKELQ